MTLSLATQAVQGSNLFVPSETLGLVTDGLPVAVFRLGTEGFVVSSVGNAFHILDIKKLHIVLRSPVLPQSIAAMTVASTGKGRIFVALEIVNEILVFERLSQVGRLAGHHKHRIIGMFVLGSCLVSWSEWEVLIWDLESFQLSGQLPIPQQQIPQHNTKKGSTNKEDDDMLDDNIGRISCLIHPETYLNKIVVGYRHGCDMQLWNIRTLKHIHSFKSVQPKSASSIDLSVGITALSLSPHPNVIGVGYSNGLLRLVDIRNDEMLCELHHFPEQGAVKSLTYRSGLDCDFPGAFVSGCENGDIVVWDTTEARMLHLVEAPHQSDCGVSLLHCLRNEPLMISSGADNSIILWIFDGFEKQPRILRQRQGKEY